MRWRGWVIPLMLMGALELWARSVGAGSDALAPPSAALLAFGRAAMDGSLWESTVFTLAGAALGLALGAGLGVIWGIALGLLPRLASMSFLSFELLRPLPSIALVPLSMLVFGFGLRMEIAVVAFATFWPVLTLTQVAVRQVEPRLLEVSFALGLSPTERIVKIVLPAIVPRLFVAFRLAVGIALVVAVMVEISANPNGVGYAMSLAQQSLDPAAMLAWLVWIGVLGVVINAATLRLQLAVARRMGGIA